ncbi:MAG TPA: hypothetical protein DEZ08_07835 [Dehalococcoidia bacterium]|jgi:hypothetical protein|nr:hypothetical protein [Dehalococcoidia bacterium]|tara:strand:- start:191 stop:496 length:306 start_codon:yes stop_codon:yes gene_type:complete
MSIIQDDMNHEFPDSTNPSIESGNDIVIDKNGMGYTPLQSHYLTLLGRLVDVQNEYKTDPSAEAWLMSAIKKSVYSAYCDCIEAKIEDPAKLILQPEQQVN